jgi:coenzyme F420-reducing hydrogenase delta subunit
MEQFMPLVSIGLKRYAYLTRRVADIAFSDISKQYHSGIGMVGQYEGFRRELRRVFDEFVASVCSACEERLHHIFRSYVQFIDGTLVSGIGAPETGLKPSFEETRKRVLSAFQSELFLAPGSLSRSQMFTEEGADMIRGVAAKLWSGIRFMMAKTAGCSLNYDFFQPVFEKLSITIQKHFNSLDEAHFDQMFQTGVAQLKQRMELLQSQVQRLTQNRDRFREVVRKLQERTTSGR